MFFYLSKTIAFLLMPLGWIFFFVLASIYLRNKNLKKWAKLISIGLTILFTNPFLANEVIGAWEYPPREFDTIAHREWGVVLTGVANNRIEPFDRVYFNKGADRVIHTVMLYQKGIIEKILISGGSGSFDEADYSEAATLKKAFLMMGVAEKDLFLEEKSKNTYQSAVNCQKFLNDKSNEIVLISSSSHLRRATACFEKAGFMVEKFPADFHASPRQFAPNAWVPSAHALSKWTVVFKELVGIITYKIMGYL